MSSRNKHFTAAIALGLLPTTQQLTNEIGASATITTTATHTTGFEIGNMLDGVITTEFR